MNTFGQGREKFRNAISPDINSWVGRKLFGYMENSSERNYEPSYDRSKDPEYPSEILYSGATVFMILAILGIAGNMLAHFVLTKDNKFKHFASTLLVNLVTIDLFISCLYTLMIALLLIQAKGSYSDENCKVFEFVKYAGSMICMLLISAIVFNRFISIVFPQTYRSIFKNKNIFFMVTFIWFFPIILLCFPVGEVGGKLAYNVETGSCDILDGSALKTFFRCIIFIITPLITVICYIAICFTVTSRKNEWSCCTSLQNPNPSEGNEGNSNSKKTQEPAFEGNDLRLLLFIFLIFILQFLCYIPLFYVRTVRRQDNYHLIHILCYAPYFFASSVKPAIYYAMSQNYRDKLKSLFTRTVNYF